MLKVPYVTVSIDAVNSAVLTCDLYARTYAHIAIGERKAAHRCDRDGETRMARYYREWACQNIAKAKAARRAGQRLMGEAVADMSA